MRQAPAGNIGSRDKYHLGVVQNGQRDRLADRTGELVKEWLE
jgi:hypothetical protein